MDISRFTLSIDIGIKNMCFVVLKHNAPIKGVNIQVDIP